MKKHKAPRKMGRPKVYDKPRTPRLIQLSDELIEAIDAIAGDGKRTEFIEKQLRANPDIAAYLEGRRQ